MKTSPLHPTSSILQTFFEKFDLFADAPDAVAKMRKLVLELAVRGRLLSSGNLDSSVQVNQSEPFPISV